MQSTFHLDSQPVKKQKTKTNIRVLLSNTKDRRHSGKIKFCNAMLIIIIVICFYKGLLIY